MSHATRTRCSTCRADAAGILRLWGVVGHLMEPSCLECAVNTMIFAKCNVKWIPVRQTVGGAR